MHNVILPRQLAGLTGGRNGFGISAGSFRELFDELDKIAPMIRSQLFHRTGELRHFVAIFMNDVQVSLDDHGLELPIPDGSEVFIMFSVAGG